MPSPIPELETLRESQDRALHLEGIPMLLALADERDTRQAVAEQPSTAALVQRMEHYRGVLARGQRQDDMGVVISILTVTAYEDFDSSASR